MKRSASLFSSVFGRLSKPSLASSVISSILLLFLSGARRSWAAETFNSLYLSEVLVESARGAATSTINDPGWIELYNGGPAAVNLAGWFLSDTGTNLTRWRFPGVVMLPGTFLLISATGSPLTNDLAHLHANFRLKNGGGELFLSARNTNTVSRLAYPKAERGISYGSVRGEPVIRGKFAEPTPGKPNQSSGSGFSPQVAFSRASGSFAQSVVLKLSCVPTNSSSNVVIRYTLDGRLPTGVSPIYREPLQITNTTVVRARAYQDGLLPGPPASANYLLLNSNVLRFQSTLPILVMSSSAGERPASSASSYLSFYEPVRGKSSLGRAPTLVTRGSFHVRGSSSASFPQSSFALTILDEFNHDENASILGLPASSDWVLYAPNMFDPVLIHNPFIHQLSRDMGHYSPRTRFVEVYLSEHAGAVTAGDYAGVYVLEEKIKISKHRVAIDRLGAEDLKPPEVTGGYLMKFDRLGPGEGGFWAGGAEMVYVDPKEAVIQLPQRAPQRRYISNFFEEFERMLESADWKDPTKGYRAYIDVDSWIDFHVLEVLSGNVDIFHFSTFFYKPRGGKLTFGPHWDFDRALGSIDHRDQNPRRWNTGRFFDAPWWSQLFRDPDFWQLWVDRWQGLRQTQFSDRNLFALIDRLADEVREAQPREAARWSLDPRGGSYQSEVDWMKTWLTERMNFIDRQLVQPPVLNHASGPVAANSELKLTAPAGAIYYTLDGSDPRSGQGGISSNAVAYAEAITLKGNTRITARARNPGQRQTGGPPISTPWSSPVSAEFTIRP